MGKLTSILLTIVFTIGAFFLGVLAMNFIIMPMVVHQRSSVIVPDVRGMSEQQAMRTLDDVSLKYRIDRTQYNSEVPENYVIIQRPRANETIKEGRSVGVVLSKGPRTQRVPDLKDKSLRQGRLLLTRRKLITGRLARVVREGDSREVVLACSPGAGQEVAEGSEVDLLVGTGGRPRRFLMPTLEGQDLLFIKEKLEGMGFRVSSIRYETRAGVYPNTIIDHFPKPGIMIREGDSIELVAAGTE